MARERNQYENTANRAVEAVIDACSNTGVQ